MVLALFLDACASTFGNLAYDELKRDVGSRVYIGTKVDAALLAAPFTLDPRGEVHQSYGLSLLMWPFALVDLPLSVVADTLLLPYSLTATDEPGDAQPGDPEEDAALNPANSVLRAK